MARSHIGISSSKPGTAGCGAGAVNAGRGCGCGCGCGCGRCGSKRGCSSTKREGVGLDITSASNGAMDSGAIVERGSNRVVAGRVSVSDIPSPSTSGVFPFPWVCDGSRKTRDGAKT
jgi:hypothetical protein